MEIPKDGENNDAFIRWLFRDRCVICFRGGNEINEIILRSQSSDALFWKNRVMMCTQHHREYHDGGTNNASIIDLQEKRKSFLIRIGRREYI